MHEYLRMIAEQPAILLDNVPDELAAFRLPDADSPIIPSTLKFVAELDSQRQLLLRCTSVIAEEFVIVLEHQLADFLPTGKYGSQPTEEALQRMKHCKLTNLIGEACFADLDFSMFKHRRAQLFYLSFLNMLKRNKTISKFLLSKDEQEQSNLLKRARKLGPQYRSQAKQQERQVQEELRAIMEKQKQQRDTKEMKKREERRRITEGIEKLGGAC